METVSEESRQKLSLLKPRPLLNLEGGAVFLASLFVYFNLHARWWLFLLLFLVPDLFMLGYLINKRIGAACYNLVHTYVLPLLIAAALRGLHRPEYLWLCVIWISHIGLDRLLGYGLKYETEFKDTHLQRV
jgi:hypothetical protein